MRNCQTCGDTYYRVNKTDVWVQRNPGHRKGWVKAGTRECVNCLSTKTAMRIVTLAQVSMVHPRRRGAAR